MSRRWLIISIVIAAFVFLVYLESRTPKELDWSPSFSLNDKIPFGSYVIFDALPDIVRDRDIDINTLPLFTTLSGDDLEGIDNLILINQSLDLDEFEVSYLLSFVARGGTAFLAAQEYSRALRDSLSIELSLLPPAIFFDTLQVQFSNPNLISDTSYQMHPQAAMFRFSRVDTSITTVLGRDIHGNVNFIRRQHGAGTFLLSSIPLAFTNYHFMDESFRPYLVNALSCIPEGNTMWDEYQKAGRENIGTPLRYILSRPALRSGYYLSLFGIVVFLVFQARRRQRLIPVITPPRNTTLEFVKTIGRLYFLNQDHKNLAEKKINHFLEEVRNSLYLRTDELDAEFCRAFSEKTGIDRQTVKRLTDLIHEIRRAEKIDIRILKKFNDDLNDIYKRM